MSLRPLQGYAIVLLLGSALIGGCAPTCKQMCRKILNDCELDTQRMSLDECNTSCTDQEDLYGNWRNEHLQQLFDDQRRCIGKSTCQQLANGACYDGYEELYSFDPDKELPVSTAPGS